MKPYVLAFKRSQDLIDEFKKIGVDRGGIEIMRTKGISRVIKVHQIPSFSANILKQEMLSLGGDVALSRGSIFGKLKKTDCLVMGNVSQIGRLTQKLKKQPFGLSGVGEDIKNVLSSFERESSILNLPAKKIHLGRKTLLAGIVNLTPDSFSGDGIFGMSFERALVFACEMAKNGADILDIGGESSRPASSSISAKEELSRVIPFFKRLRKKTGVPLSIDTTKSEVARAALDLGASIVNDISALRSDKKMAKLVARYKAGLVLMHMKGTPRTMQHHPQYGDCMDEIIGFLCDAIKKALDAGISEDKIIIDPGIGFGKKIEHNLEILERLSSLKSIGRPILVGVSRKWFIGKILNADVHNRIWGSAAAVATAIANGADIVRVHDVKEMKDVILVADAIIRKRDAHGR